MPQRFKVISLTVAAVFICYIDRVVISLAIIPMSEEAGWTETQKGIVLGSFYIGYMVTQIWGGTSVRQNRGKDSFRSWIDCLVLVYFNNSMGILWRIYCINNS